MNLSPADIRKIGHLARLAITDAEVQRLSQDLTRILDLVDQMAQADTANVPPLAHPYDQAQPLRADEVTERDERALFQRIAPQTQAGLYLVPQVIDSE